MMAIKLTSQVLWHAWKCCSETKTVYSGAGNKDSHCNLPTRFSINENSLTGNVLKQGKPRDWKVNRRSRKPKTNVTQNCVTLTSLTPKRRAERKNIYCQQSNGELDSYFDSLQGWKVTSVSLHKRPSVSFKDRRSFTLDDKYRVTIHDSTWFGLDGELPEQSDEDPGSHQNHPQVENQIVEVELLMGHSEHVSEVLTVIVPVDQKLRDFWMRVDLKLSKGARFEDIMVSYLDFNLLNDNAWIDGRPIKVTALVSELRRRISRGDWINVVQIKAEQVHGYHFKENRWFAVMQVRLLAGTAEIVLGDLNNHLGTGTWPTAVPYKEGHQDQMNTYV